LRSLFHFKSPTRIVGGLFVAYGSPKDCQGTGCHWMP
jgi:hypothetical protein